MGKNHKARISPGQAAHIRQVAAQFARKVSSKIVITSYTSGPPTMETNEDVVGLIRGLAAGLMIAANSLAKSLAKMEEKEKAPAGEKKREYLGPREEPKKYEVEGP